MIYLNNLNWDIIGNLQPGLLERFTNERNFLLMIGSFWFQEITGYDEAIRRFREEDTNTYLKVCSPFLPRMNERLIVSEELIEAILKNVTPFFDIYLPFEVRIHPANLSKSPTLAERINKLTKISEHWTNKELDQDQQTKLKDLEIYIAELNQYDNLVKMGKRLKYVPTFKYSFSLYLVDLLMFPLNQAKKRLVINHYYVYGNTEDVDELIELIPTSELQSELPTTLVLEFRDMGERIGAFTGVFNDFIEKFYKLSLKN